MIIQVWEARKESTVAANNSPLVSLCLWWIKKPYYSQRFSYHHHHHTYLFTGENTNKRKKTPAQAFVLFQLPWILFSSSLCSENKHNCQQFNRKLMRPGDGDVFPSCVCVYTNVGVVPACFRTFVGTGSQCHVCPPYSLPVLLGRRLSQNQSHQFC